MFDEKEIEVYQYVKENATKYLSTIIKAMQDGLKEENFRMREQKSKVEAGVIVLLEKVKISKIPENRKSVLIDALENGTFFKFDSLIKELKGHKQICDCEVQPCELHKEE